MAKTRENYAAGELLTTAKLNQVVIDYVQAGALVFNQGVAVTHGTVTNPWYVQPYPYNGAKSVFDRWRIIAGGSSALDPEYTTDSGANWTAVPAGGVPPITLHGYANSWDHTEDLSAIAGLVWLGLRWPIGVAHEAFVQAFLYNSDHDPF